MARRLVTAICLLMSPLLLLEKRGDPSLGTLSLVIKPWSCPRPWLETQTCRAGKVGEEKDSSLPGGPDPPFAGVNWDSKQMA